MKKRSLHDFSEFLDLVLAATNISICDIGLLFNLKHPTLKRSTWRFSSPYNTFHGSEHTWNGQWRNTCTNLHHGDCWVDFSGERQMNLVLIAVHSNSHAFLKEVALNTFISSNKNSRRCLQRYWKSAVTRSHTIYPLESNSNTSISVGATVSARSTTNFANCFTLIMYLGSCPSPVMIFVHLATWKQKLIACYILLGKEIQKSNTWRGCSCCIACLSAAISHNAGGARPVSDSFTPDSSFTCKQRNCCFLI